MVIYKDISGAGQNLPCFRIIFHGKHIYCRYGICDPFLPLPGTAVVFYIMIVRITVDPLCLRITKFDHPDPCHLSGDIKHGSKPVDCLADRIGVPYPCLAVNDIRNYSECVVSGHHQMRCKLRCLSFRPCDHPVITILTLFGYNQSCRISICPAGHPLQLIEISVKDLMTAFMVERAISLIDLL